MTDTDKTDEYKCGSCGAAGVRLWREYQTFAPSLFCVTCALSSSHAGSATAESLRGCDQIGWLVPAVPADGGWWGYSSVPDEGVAWWYALPCALPVRRDFARKESTP